MARGKASGGKKPSSGAGGSALGASRGADAKEQALRAECLKCYEIFTKKGALARATKELDKLVDGNPSHPLVRYARVRLAHREALDQTRQEMVAKKFDEAKKAARAAADACPDSIVMKAVFLQTCLDCPDEGMDDIDGMLREMHALVNAEVEAVNDRSARVDANGTGDADDDASETAKHLRLEAFAETFKEELMDCLELDKELLSMCAFPRVSLKGMKSKAAPKAREFLKAWVVRLNEVIHEKRLWIGQANTERKRAGTSDAAGFMDAYIKYRDVNRKNSLADDGANANVRAEQAKTEKMRLELTIDAVQKARRAREENERRGVSSYPDAPQPMDVDGGDGAPRQKADSPPARGKASAPVPAAVRQFWKAQVARDPSAVLRLTDVSVFELRAFAERDKSGVVAESLREALRAAAERGAFRVWRCGVIAEACDEDGTHDSEEACLRCIERHIPRVSPALRVAGDARTWLAPIAQPGDVALEADPAGAAAARAAADADALSRSQSGQSLLHETDAFPEHPCSLVWNDAYVPTPGSLGARVGGRAAPLLSVDPDVLRRDAALRGTDEAARVSDRPPGAVDPASPEYEFAGPAANGANAALPMRPEEAELHAQRVAAFEDALARLRVEGPESVERLREHAQHPGLLPRLHAEGEGGARGDGFLREGAGGFAIAERHASVADTGFLARLGVDSEAFAERTETAGPSAPGPPNAGDTFSDARSSISVRKKHPRALGLREHAANLRSIQETLRARARASGSDASVTSVSGQSPEREAYAAVAAALAPVENPEHVSGEKMPSWTKADNADERKSGPPAEDATCLSDILASLRILADASSLPLRALQSIAQFCAAREAARAEEKETYTARAGEGVRRRRGGVGLLGVSGRAERVLSASPEAKAPVGRPTLEEPLFASPSDRSTMDVFRTTNDVDGTVVNPNAPVRGFDDLVARLRRLSGEDLRAVWLFCRERWSERAATATLAARADGLTVAVPDALSARSPVFGLVSVSDAGGNPPETLTSETSTSKNAEEKRKSKGGKGGKGVRNAGGSSEWVKGERALALRVSRGVWRELYGDAGSETTGFTPETGPVPVQEAFLGEHFVKWLWKRDGDGPVAAAAAETSTKKKAVAARDDDVAAASLAARLEANDTLVRGLLVSKLEIRRKVDACVVLAGRLATGECSPRDWDHATEKGVAAFRALWSRSAFFAFSLNELRRALLERDVAELEQRRSVLESLTGELAEEYEVLHARAKKAEEEQQSADKTAKAKRQISAKLVSQSAADAFDAARDRRRLVVEECEKRKSELKNRFDIARLVEIPSVEHASQRLRIELNMLERPNRSDRADVEMALAEDGSPYLRCSRARRDRREADLREWIKNEGALVPASTDALANATARIPFRLATPLALAQARLAKLDLQMEAAQSARARTASGAHLARAAASDASVAALESAFAAAICERLERLAAAAAADEAVAEQERLLAEEGEASEARRAKEEKARAKRAKEKARAREARAAEEAERQAEKAAAARAAAARAAEEASRRVAEEAARAAERRDSQEAAEAALAERRAQLLVEEARHMESERRALELAVKVSQEHERARERAQAEARSKVAEAERVAAKAARAAEDAEKAATSLNASASDFRPARTETVAAVDAYASPPPAPPAPPLPPGPPPGYAARAPSAPAAPAAPAVPLPPPPGFSAQTPPATHAWGAPAYASPHVSPPLDLRAAAAAAAARLAEANAEARLARAQLAALEAAGYAAEAPFADQPPAWPSLAPPAAASAPPPSPPAPAEGAESEEEVEEEVDDQGFAVDDLEAALKASMTETKGRPPSPFDAGDAAAASASALARSGSAAGLRNLEGEYNCFLNVVIQSLWHVSAFRDAMRRWEPSAFAKKQDADVARALRDVFDALDASRDAATTKSSPDAVVSAASPPPSPQVAPGPAAPTALRAALSALLDGEGALFAEREMADASEALQAIFHAVHRACEPNVNGSPNPPRAERSQSRFREKKSARDEGFQKSNGARGAFLDEESGYRSLAHDIFGLDVEESVSCGSCVLKTHTLRYTKFLHLLPVAALNEACASLGEDDETKTSRAIRVVDARDCKSCDLDAGGCGRVQPLTHTVVRANGTPETFCVALTWETANADAATVRETVANVDETVSLCVAFGESSARKKTASEISSEVSPSSSRESYALKCVLCYYGEHYCAFATADARCVRDGEEEAGKRRLWTLFDDATTKPVGAWEDVQTSCEKGRLQPCVLFYQKMRGDERDES